MEVEIKDYDVLFGRGNGVSQHPGNRRFRDLIKAYRPLYMQAPRYSRAQIASNVIAMIQWGNPPGRFLEDIGTGYYQVASHPRILEKAMQALRGRSLDSRPSTSFSLHSASVSSESVNSREDPVETSEMALDCSRRDSSSGHTSSSFTSELNRLQANNSRHSSFEDNSIEDLPIEQQSRLQSSALSNAVPLHPMHNTHSFTMTSGKIFNTSQAIHDYCVRHGYLS